MAADEWGIEDGWVDTSGTWRSAPVATTEAIRSAMGAPHGRRSVWVVRPGADDALPARGHLVLEDGQDVGEVDRLPPDLPLGIHEIAPLDGGVSLALIVSPGRCHLPDDLREWGVTMQVPTTRSRRSWGIGDLGDVGAVARWLAEQGGRVLALSPLHSPTPVGAIQASPYYPSSRRWRNPLLLDVMAVPGAQRSTLAPLAASARALLADPVVDRDGVWALKRSALEQLWEGARSAAAADLKRFRTEHGPSLEGWARFCTLAEELGGQWRSWPEPLRHPGSTAVDAAAAERSDRVAFHAWLQLLLDDQLRAAGQHGVRLVQDLAIGADPSGADAWLWQDLLADGFSVGAPPDDFAPDGQRWGLPPFVPWRLRDAGYRPLAELLRGCLAPGGGLRVDHVMGLTRLFWVPEGGTPAEGAYVRFAGRELLEVLAMESARAQSLVIGEDLGTVEPGFRDELARTGILSTRLVWFEDAPPEDYPRQALGMVTTHDLPTIAGQWTGADEQELVALGRPTPAAAASEVHQRLARLVDEPATAPAQQVVVDLHRRLGRSAAALVLATLEDVTGVTRRPNVPGTTDERPNWSLALPCSIEDLPPAPVALEALAEGRESSSGARSGI